MTPPDGNSSTGGPLRVLAVADSDSYLKWACWTVDRLRGGQDGADPSTAVVVLRSPIAPTRDQVTAAALGTEVLPPPVVGVAALRRLVRRERPDVVLVAATGPVAELVARHVVGAVRGPRPALVAGLPGMALPATAQGTGWRRWCDAFVVHARVEAEPYRAAFADHGSTPELPLTRLPFLDVPAAHRAAPGRGPSRIVLAAQAKVPAARAERLALLDSLARLAQDGTEVVVKLRARAGERQTHNEEYPLDELWDAGHRGLGHPAGAVTFATGAMGDHLVPGTALVTVSSTAALESLARGLPTVFVADFGVGPHLLNEQFARSGCLLRVADVPAASRAGGPAPDPAWCEDHYLHSTPSELPAVVDRLARRSRADALPPLTVQPWSWPRHLYTLLRSLLPVRLARALGPDGIRRGGRRRRGR
ncbi:DUF6716 putative glycosyltransferase [Isoptericola aurantiacus]|uniref:DUF6716 putative glycosyltransferase n=1 Tax=Isoptericola aurantiacus TaxID=3377839 RepID=UPI00383B7C9C